MCCPHHVKEEDADAVGARNDETQRATADLQRQLNEANATIARQEANAAAYGATAAANVEATRTAVHAAACAAQAASSASDAVRDLLLTRHSGRSHGSGWMEKKRLRAERHAAAGHPLASASAHIWTAPTCVSCGKGQPGQGCANGMCSTCCVWYRQQLQWCPQHHTL